MVDPAEVDSTVSYIEQVKKSTVTLIQPNHAEPSEVQIRYMFGNVDIKDNDLPF
jgi:F420-dependent methylenetetrahydromethanopterin dehydrogenase